ncbi:MAG: hypothetical protein JWM31_27 [Solirubrobacterales bacterium]|nr:hypothetical protein [Solirubrobacterales bacterium]
MSASREPRNRAIRGSLVVGAALWLGACGGDSTKTVTAPAPVASTSTTGATGPTGVTGATTQAKPAVDGAAKAADLVLAQKGRLRLSDFPNTWTQADPTNDETAGSPCDTLRNAKKATSGRASAADFGMGQDSLFENTVYVYPDEIQAMKWTAALGTPGTRKCLAKSVADSLKGKLTKGAKLGDPSTGVANVPRGDADAVVASRIDLPVGGTGLDSTIAVEYVEVRVGRVVSLILAFQDGSTIDDDLRDRLVQSTSRRLRSLTNATVSSGTSSSTAADARKTVTDYYAKIAAGDASGACALMTDAGKAATVRRMAATFKGKTCEEDLAQLRPFATGTRITGLNVKGTRATARTQTGSNSPAVLNLVSAPGGWKING